MAHADLPPLDPRDVPEPGAELDERLSRIEERVRAQFEGAAPGTPSDALVQVSSREVLLLIACIRELLRDREALLEEIEALECAAGWPQAR